MVDGGLPVVDVAVGDNIEDNGLEFGLGHRFSLFGILVDGNGRPNHLTLFEERVVVVAVIVFNESQKVIDNGRSGDSAFVVALVVQEAIQEDMLQGFTAETFVFTLGKLVGREAARIAWEKG